MSFRPDEDDNNANANASDDLAVAEAVSLVAKSPSKSKKNPSEASPTQSPTSDKTNSDSYDDDEEEHDIVSVDADDVLPLPLDRGYAWVITFASMMVSFLVDGISNSFGLMLVDFCDYFNADKASVTLIGSLLCGVGMLTGPIVGSLVNKFGCRPVCMAGAVISSFAFILSSFATELWMLTLTYGVLGGIGFGFIYLPAMVCVSFYFERYRALAMGLAVCGTGIGTIVMGPVTNALLDSMGWQNTMVILAGIALNGAVLGAFLRPNEPSAMAAAAAGAGGTPSIAGSRIRLHQLSVSEAQNNNAAAATGTVVPPTAVPDIVVDSQMVRVDQLAEQYVRRSRLDSEDQSVGATAVGGLATIPEAMQPVPEAPRSGAFPRPFPKKRLDSDRRIFSSTISGFDVSSVGNLSDPDALLKSLPTLFARKRVGAARKSKADKVARARQFDIAQIKAGLTTATLADLRRPIYRRDIFYSGSVMNLTSARVRKSQQSLAPSLLFLSMARIPGEAPAIQQSPDSDAAALTSRELPRTPDCLRCLPKSIVDAFLMMVNFSLMKDLGFLMIWLANLMVMLAFYVPLFFVSDFAREIRVSESQGRYLNSAFGTANTLCRILVGWVAGQPHVSPLLINNLSLLLSGVFAIMLNFCTGFWTLITVYTILGVCLAPVITLTSEILCKQVGLDNLTNAFGLVTLARGISACVGSPITALLYNEHTKYSLPFSVGGALFIAGSMIFSVLFLPRFRRKEEKNQQDVDNVIRSMQNLNASLLLVDGNQLLATSAVDLRLLASPQRKSLIQAPVSAREENEYLEETV